MRRYALYRVPILVTGSLYVLCVLVFLCACVLGLLVPLVLLLNICTVPLTLTILLLLLLLCCCCWWQWREATKGQQLAVPGWRRRVGGQRQQRQQRQPGRLHRQRRRIQRGRFIYRGIFRTHSPRLLARPVDPDQSLYEAGLQSERSTANVFQDTFLIFSFPGITYSVNRQMWGVKMTQMCRRFAQGLEKREHPHHARRWEHM